MGVVSVSDWATVNDVQVRYEEPISSSSVLSLETKLDDAEAIIISKMGPIQAAIDAGRTTADLVKIVLCNMVLRWLRNPTGMQQETVGPFSYSRDSGVASGRLFLSKDDRGLLGLQRGAVSLQLADDALRHPTRWPCPPDMAGG
jgi:hypothetical protein